MRVFGYEVPSVTGMFGAPGVNQVESRQGSGAPAERHGISRGWTFDPLTDMTPPGYGIPADYGPSNSLPPGSINAGLNAGIVGGSNIGRSLADISSNPEAGGGVPPQYNFAGPNIGISNPPETITGPIVGGGNPPEISNPPEKSGLPVMRPDPGGISNPPEKGGPPVMRVIDPNTGTDYETDYRGYMPTGLFNRTYEKDLAPPETPAPFEYAKSLARRFGRGFLGFGRSGTFLESSSEYQEK